MIALRKSKAFLALVSAPQLPRVDVARIAVGPRSLKLGPGVLVDAEKVWLVEPGTGQLTRALPVLRGGVTVRTNGGPEQVLWVAGEGGWVQVRVGPEGRSVRPVSPRVDGAAIGFSEAGFVCREPAVIGYERVVLTVWHPVGGAERRLELAIDVVTGTFETGAYLGLSAGDRVQLELFGAREPLERSFVFPRAPDRWRTYSLDELAQGLGERSPRGESPSPDHLACAGVDLPAAEGAG